MEDHHHLLFPYVVVNAVLGLVDDLQQQHTYRTTGERGCSLYSGSGDVQSARLIKRYIGYSSPTSTGIMLVAT